MHGTIRHARPWSEVRATERRQDIVDGLALLAFLAVLALIAWLYGPAGY